MKIGSVDNYFRKRQQRADWRNKLLTPYYDENQSSSTEDVVFQNSPSSNENSSETGNEFAPSSYHESVSLKKRALVKTPTGKPPQKSKKWRLMRVAEACARAGISEACDRAGISDSGSL